MVLRCRISIVLLSIMLDNIVVKKSLIVSTNNETIKNILGAKNVSNNLKKKNYIKYSFTQKLDFWRRCSVALKDQSANNSIISINRNRLKIVMRPYIFVIRVVNQFGAFSISLSLSLSSFITRYLLKSYFHILYCSR